MPWDIGKEGEGSARLTNMNSKFEAGFAPDVVEVKPMRGYRLWLKFIDGNEGIADLSDLSYKTGGRSLWRSMRDFRKAEAKYDTVSWPREDGGTIEMSPFSLYVRAGLATWEELDDPGDEKERPRATAVRDCERDRLWVELDTGDKGYIKVPGDLADSLEEFTLPDRPKGESFILTSGDIVWKNEFWLDTEDVEKVLAERRNGLAV